MKVYVFFTSSSSAFACPIIITHDVIYFLPIELTFWIEKKNYKSIVRGKQVKLYDKLLNSQYGTIEFVCSLFNFYPMILIDFIWYEDKYYYTSMLLLLFTKSKHYPKFISILLFSVSVSVFLLFNGKFIKKKKKKRETHHTETKMYACGVQ